MKEESDLKNIDEKHLNQEDHELLYKIIKLKEFMPEELHTCIGCPCLENDYPKCENCIFYESCSSGNPVYPEGCVENDCFNSFNWMYKNEKLLSQELKGR